MIMIYYPFDWKCEFFPERYNQITIEKKEVFERFLINLDSCIQKTDDLFYMEDDEKEIKIDKSVVMISSPLDLKFSKKDYQKVLYNTLVEELQVNELQEKIAEHYAGLLEEIDALRTLVQYNIEYEGEIDYSGIFKMLDIEIEQPKGTFCEKLLDYLQTEVRLLNKKVFFVINCHTYIEEKWYDEIVKWAEYQGVVIVFVENQQIGSNKNINEYILDEDMCEIH